MTHRAHLVLFAGASGLLLVGCAATPPQIPRYTIEQVMDSEHVVGASFSHDGSRIAFASNRSGVVNLYVAPFDGGEAQPLTHSQDDAIFLAEFFPHDDRLLYISDRGGD